MQEISSATFKGGGFSAEFMPIDVIFLFNR